MKWMAVLLLGVLAACQPSFGGRTIPPNNTAGGTTNGQTGTTHLTANGVQPFLYRMPDAPERVAFQGVRTVWMKYEFRGVVRPLRYRERVSSDGRGRFAIDPLDVIQPDLSAADSDAFANLQKSREAFFFRYRDFRIQDLNLFFQNYEITYLPTDTQVADIRCVQLEVRRRQDPDRYYVIAVDPVTALVLRFDERTLDEHAIGGMTFDSLDLAPDLSRVSLTEGAHALRELSFDEPLEDQVGFEPLRPSLPPTGFQLLQAHVFEVPDPSIDGNPTTKWVRYVYGDGLEKVFFLTSQRHDSGGLDVGDFGTPTPVAAQRAVDRVRVSTVGPWTLVDGSVGSWRVIAMGKVAEDQILQMVQSGLE